MIDGVPAHRCGCARYSRGSTCRDVMIVATVDDPTILISTLERQGISRTRLASLREPRPEATDHG